MDRVYEVSLTDASGEVYATIEKTLYIRRKDAESEAKVGEQSQEVA